MIYIKIRLSYEFEISGYSKLRLNGKYVFICLPIWAGSSSCIIIIRFSPISDERILYVKLCGLPSSGSNMAHNTLEVSFVVYRRCTRLISLSAASTGITHDFYFPFNSLFTYAQCTVLLCTRSNFAVLDIRSFVNAVFGAYEHCTSLGSFIKISS